MSSIKAKQRIKAKGMSPTRVYPQALYDVLDEVKDQIADMPILMAEVQGAIHAGSLLTFKGIIDRTPEEFRPMVKAATMFTAARLFDDEFCKAMDELVVFMKKNKLGEE